MLLAVIRLDLGVSGNVDPGLWNRNPITQRQRTVCVSAGV